MPRRITIAECHKELERVCRIVVDYKIDEGGGDLKYFRENLKATLDKLTDIRFEKARLAALKAEKKNRRNNP